MVEQISTIASGTLIDQSVLSTIINNVNEITNSQYSSTSYLANDLSTSQIALQNGQWIVSTIYQKSVTASLKSTLKETVGPTTVNFGVSFAAKPMISGMMYDDSASDVLYSIIITDIGLDYFKYKVVFDSVSNPVDITFNLMFTAIGKAKL